MWTRSALEHAKAIRNREITSLELVNYYIKRIEKYDGKINSVVVRVFESARRKASEADRAIAEGRDVGPLHGVPITVKESFWVKHTRSTCAISDLPFFKDFVATSTAPAVKRLLDAGGTSNIKAPSISFRSLFSRFHRFLRHAQTLLTVSFDTHKQSNTQKSHCIGKDECALSCRRHTIV